MRTIFCTFCIMLIFSSIGCNKSTAPSQPIIDPHPTEILSVTANDQVLLTQSAEASVSINEILRIVITAIDKDMFAKYIITQNNMPVDASSEMGVNTLSDTLKTNVNFVADTTSYLPGHVKPGDVIIWKYTFVDRLGFTKAQSIKIYIKQ